MMDALDPSVSPVQTESFLLIATAASLFSMHRSRQIVSRLRWGTLVVSLFMGRVGFAQNDSDFVDHDSFAKVPQAIAFQNDSQWEDNRWQHSDIGPFLSGIIAVGKSPTLKGIAIRVGDRGQAAVCFDTARMRISGAWTGDFLSFDPRRFGLIRFPEAAGEMVFTTDPIAGWAQDGRFRPRREELLAPLDRSPVIDGGPPPAANSETRLPKDWTHYRGLYTSGDRVVLSYTVGTTEVLEMPWFVEAEGVQAFTRTFEIAPSEDELQLWVAGDDARVIVIGGDGKTASQTDRPVLRVLPHTETLRIKLLITHGGQEGESNDSLRALADAPEDLSALIARDAGRFPEVLTTVGTTTESPGPYVMDTLTLPFKNPWNALFFTAGHDFFSDGSAAICTVHGDVWTVDGIDRDLAQLRWRRFATGLSQPLGLKIVDDQVHVIGRGQVTRLHDRNGDGEADFYENLNNDLLVAPRAHDFVAGLETDASGNFYFIHAITGLMKLSADGTALVSIADGFRNPNGMGVSPEGMITAAPQQGTWTPESSLVVVQAGGYYGFGGPRITAQRPTGWDLPMCFIPRPMDNSGGGQVWVEGDRWGPLAGKMLHLSYGQCRMLLALTEPVDGIYQGGTIEFPTDPGDFESGVMRGRFNPHDGQLYVSGLRGWQTRSIRDGCFQRVRYTGAPVHLPVAIKTFTNGIKLTFTESLDESMATNPDNYLVEQWNYLYSKEYGSPQFSVSQPKEQGRDEVEVVSATLMDDGQAVFLEMPSRHVVHQLSMNWFLTAASGESIRGTFAHTINTEPAETVPEEDIVRRPRTQFVAPEVVDRLAPGLAMEFRSLDTDETDVRVSRLAAFRQPVAAPPTPFLPAGPFTVQATGTIRMPRSGLHDFKLAGTGHARLSINGEVLVELPGDATTAQPVMVRKGHNHLLVEYRSPSEGDASLDLSWRGFDFGWEPLPPDMLFHDTLQQSVVTAQQRRHGRNLFAAHRCAACHQSEVGSAPMFELTLPGVDLESVGSRLNQDWLGQWLLSPTDLRPGTTMPAVLGDGDEAKQSAADVAAFLASRFVLSPRGGVDRADGNPPATTDALLAREGERLYETLGCITCHHFEKPSVVDDFGRLSLYHVDAKFRRGAMVTFLQRPATHHPGIRMPDFDLTTEEAQSLVAFVRRESAGKVNASLPAGDATRGRRLFAESGCQQCHQGGDAFPGRAPGLVWKEPSTLDRGCLADGEHADAPEFSLNRGERAALAKFIQHDLASLARHDPIETAGRLYQALQCASCHDRDGARSHRGLVMAEEGSGRLPEVLPALTWSGEKLRSDWMQKLFAGEWDDKSRPWIAARMPAFPAYANALASGIAAEHGVTPSADEGSAGTVDAKMAEIGEQLTLQSGLDCRQCHAIGDLQPRGDKDTKVAIGINFTHLRDRLRHDAYHRFMLDPPRYDVNTAMIKLSENGLTTKLKNYFDADAAMQFEALWNYIQSLPKESTSGGH